MKLCHKIHCDKLLLTDEQFYFIWKDQFDQSLSPPPLVSLLDSWDPSTKSVILSITFNIPRFFQKL